jgi:uncharacterized C2H2 Zn-finger protein
MRIKRKQRRRAKGQPIKIYDEFPLVCPKCQNTKLTMTDYSSDMNREYIYLFNYTCSCGQQIAYYTKMKGK